MHLMQRTRGVLAELLGATALAVRSLLGTNGAFQVTMWMRVPPADFGVAALPCHDSMEYLFMFGGSALLGIAWLG